MFSKTILKIIQNLRKHGNKQKKHTTIMREQAKVKIDLVRTHQPQEDVDTIRSMIKNMAKEMVANFTTIIVSMFKLIHQKLKKIIMGTTEKEHDDDLY